MKTSTAWAAGLFVGEGSICIKRASHNKKYAYLYLQLGMRDKRAVKLFCNLFGITFTPLWLKDKKFYFYKATAQGRTAERVFAAMWPYLKGTDKGDQVLAKAKELKVADWVTGRKTGTRPRAPWGSLRGERANATQRL